MRCDPGARRPVRTAAILSVVALVLGGCSTSGTIRGPSWNLTGGRDAVPPPPPKPSEPLRPIATAPSEPAPVITYRGGRDPVTGRAPPLGAPPQGLDQRGWEHTQPAPAPRPVPRPSAAPSLERAPLPPPATQASPLIPMPSPKVVPGGRRTVDVLPGHSLAMIAKRHHVSIAALMQVNGLRDPYVYPGQQLVLP